MLAIPSFRGDCDFLEFGLRELELLFREFGDKFLEFEFEFKFEFGDKF